MKFIEQLKPHSLSWLNKRIPIRDATRLGHSNLFIMPTRFGMALLFCCALLFTLGTNYQNNPILILCYVLISWFLVALYACFFNLNKVEIKLVKVEDAYCHNSFNVKLHIATHRLHFQWQLYDDKQLIDTFHTIDNDKVLNIKLDAKLRGQQTLPRLKLKTTFPFGLFQCWSYLRFAKTHWVYPASKKGIWKLQELWTQGESQEQLLTQASTIHNLKLEEDFEGIKPYRLGESLSKVSWKHQAKQPSGDLLLKDFSSNGTVGHWLTLQTCEGDLLEDKLSVMVFACLTIERNNEKYGIKLYGFGGNAIEIEQNSGPRHLHLCLKCLANYALPESSQADL